MHPDQERQSKQPFDAQRPFPWRCRHCGKSQVGMSTVSYDAEVRHDGRVYTFTVPHLNLPACRACGQKVFTEQVDDQINAALRSHLHLLTAEEMRTALQRLNMN